MKKRFLLFALPVLLSLFAGNVSASDDCSGSRTFSQGGWGANPKGNFAPNYLADHFADVFGTDGLVIGSTNKLKLTSASAVKDFLPSGSTSVVLPAGTKTNPGDSYKNNAAGQLVALTLNVVFDDKDDDFASSSTKLKDHIIADGVFKDMTVEEFLDIANKVIGGSSTAYTIVEVGTAAAAINLNYEVSGDHEDEENQDNGYLICPKERTKTLKATLTLSSSILCNGDLTGAVTSAVTGGNTPYTYAWSNGSTSANITGLAAGEYSLTVTDSKGTTSTASIVLNQPTALQVAASGSNLTCFESNDGTLVASVSGGTAPYEVSWSNGALTDSVSQQAAGTYVVTITDANGCAASASVTITQPDSLIAVATATNVSCYGNADGALSLAIQGGTAPYVVSWSNSAETTEITGLIAGTYVASVTDAHGCSVGVTVEITQPEMLVATADSSDVLCNGSNEGTATVSVTGGTVPYSVIWSNGATTESISGLLAGVYTATVTDAHNCSTSVSVTVNEPAKLEVSASSENVTCFGSSDGKAIVTAMGGTGIYSYEWSNGAGSDSISGLEPNTYVVVVTDQNGCSASTFVTISQPELLEASLSSENVVCYGSNDGTASVTVTGGTAPYSYSWSNGATTSSISGLAPGAYNVLVIDAHYCSVSAELSIAQPDELKVNGIETTSVTCDNGTGTATVSVIGGTAPFTYNWVGLVEQTANVANLPEGTWQLVVTDAHGCTATSSTTMTMAPIVLTTVTPGGWGAKASGNNWGTYLNSHFAASFPTGLTVGSNGRLVTLTSAAAIRNFLPSGGSSVSLKTGTMVNPTSSTLKNTLVGQTVTLVLNTVFDADNATFGASTTLLKDMLIGKGDFKGWTVAQVLAEANKALGSSSKESLSDLTSVLSSINQNYDNGTSNNGFLVSPCSGITSHSESDDNDDDHEDESDSDKKSESSKLSVDQKYVHVNLKESSKVKVNLYDQNGQLVGKLYEGCVNAGESKDVELGRSNLTNGLYVVRLISEKCNENVKVLLK